MSRGRTLGVASFALGCGVVALGAWWVLRPNRAEVDERLVGTSWAIVADGSHNSNTDLRWWRGSLLLVHASSPWHLGSERSRLLVKRSRDGHRFETLAELRVPGHDIRDPKVAEIGGRLLLFALVNSHLYATPDTTVVASSRDGVHWSPFEPVEPRGWLFWRPKSRDGRVWYVAAYWHEHGRSLLLRSSDGLRWTRVSVIHEGDGNDETAIEFLPDGRMLATARLEITPDAVLGNREASTWIGVASPPYRRWHAVRSRLTRLDGPVLFRVGKRIFAVARYQPGPRGAFTRLGSALARKRTSIFEVRPEGLVRLTDLPSAGDTSYAGVARQGPWLWIDYYTSRIDRDVPWLLGMFLPTEIRLTRIAVKDLLAAAERVVPARAPARRPVRTGGAAPGARPRTSE